MQTKQDEDRFQRGIEQFNSLQFFEAHETWEEIWLAAPEPEKTFLQGIIQVSAAFHHYRRGNRSGTQSLLRAGLRRLESFPENHRGIQLSALRAAGSRWAAAMAAGDDPGDAELPRIKRAACLD